MTAYLININYQCVIAFYLGPYSLSSLTMLILMLSDDYEFEPRIRISRQNMKNKSKKIYKLFWIHECSNYNNYQDVLAINSKLVFLVQHLQKVGTKFGVNGYFWVQEIQDGMNSFLTCSYEKKEHTHFNQTNSLRSKLILKCWRYLLKNWKSSSNTISVDNYFGFDWSIISQLIRRSTDCLEYAWVINLIGAGQKFH